MLAFFISSGKKTRALPLLFVQLVPPKLLGNIGMV